MPAMIFRYANNEKRRLWDDPKLMASPSSAGCFTTQRWRWLRGSTSSEALIGSWYDDDQWQVNMSNDSINLGNLSYPVMMPVLFSLHVVVVGGIKPETTVDSTAQLLQESFRSIAG